MDRFVRGFEMKLERIEDFGAASCRLPAKRDASGGRPPLE